MSLTRSLKKGILLLAKNKWLETDCIHLIEMTKNKARADTVVKVKNRN